MIVSEEHALVAFKSAVAKVRADVVQAWASEQLPLVRERLWIEYQSIERIEENISAEFRELIRRGAGE
jgi:hypothetical protein